MHTVRMALVAVSAAALLTAGPTTGPGEPGTARAIDRTTSLAADLQADQPGEASTIEEIYEALRPESLRTLTGTTVFERGGSDIHFEYDLVNRSDEAVTIPYLDYHGSWFHLAGVEQSWIERLGPRHTISCTPWAGRKGTWYAAGGQILATAGPVTLQPGESLLRQFRLSGHTTACFKAGVYRYRIEYKPLDGGLDDVIAEVAIDLTFQSDGPAAPTPRPTPDGGSLKPTPSPPPTSTLDAPRPGRTDGLGPGLVAVIAGALAAVASSRRRLSSRPRE